MFKISVRWFTTSKLLSHSFTVGNVLKGTENIKTFMKESSKTSWRVSDLLEASQIGTKDTVGKPMLNKLLELSGLSTNLSAEEESQLIKSLNEQLNFINQLHAVEVDPAKSDNQIHRLIEDNSDKFLTYEDLIEEIKLSEPSGDKGESDGSWEPLKLTERTQEGYFIVREGLIKANKQ